MAWRYGLYFLMLETIFYQRAQNKIYIFVPPCNILYLVNIIILMRTVYHSEVYLRTFYCMFISNLTRFIHHPEVRKSCWVVVAWDQCVVYDLSLCHHHHHSHLLDSLYHVRASPSRISCPYPPKISNKHFFRIYPAKWSRYNLRYTGRS